MKRDEYIKRGLFLLELRKEHNLTQQQLGDILFVSRETVSKWERGVSTPDTEMVLTLSKLYNVSVNEILFGEYKTKENEEQINNAAIVVMKEAESRISRIVKVFITIIIIIITSFFTLYFINNYNSIKVYIISSESDKFLLTQGSLITSNEKIYIQLGEIINLTDEEIKRIKLYYKDDKEELTIVSNDGDKILEVKLGEKEAKEIGMLKRIINNLYLEITTENYKEVLKINFLLDYSNSSLFPNLKTNEDKIITTPINNRENSFLIKFKDKDGKLIYKTDNYTYEYDDINEIVLIDNNNLTSYSIKKGVLNIKSKITFDITENKCITGNCNEYEKEINTIITELYE